jgi:hypothetical protein
VHEAGQEDGGSQVSPVSTTPLPQVIAPPLPPDPGTPPVCAVPPVVRPPVLDSPPVAGEPPAPPELLDRVVAPPAPPEPLARVAAPPAPPEPLAKVAAPPAPPKADVPPGLAASTGFEAALVPPCPPWPPVMDAVASAWKLASPPGPLPASAPPGRPPLLKLQPRNETKNPGMKKTTAIRCMARLLAIWRRSVADFGQQVRQSWAAATRALSAGGGRPGRSIRAHSG